MSRTQVKNPPWSLLHVQLHFSKTWRLTVVSLFWCLLESVVFLRKRPNFGFRQLQICHTSDDIGNRHFRHKVNRPCNNRTHHHSRKQATLFFSSRTIIIWVDKTQRNNISCMRIKIFQPPRGLELLESIPLYKHELRRCCKPFCRLSRR